MMPRMLLVELATQGVKGCSPSSRAILKAAYNVLVPPPGASAAFSALLQALLFNDGRGSDVALAVGPGSSRAGLTFAGSDGQTYRIIRNLGGPGALQRLTPGANTWSVLTQDTAEINQLLRSAGAPTPAQFAELFLLAASRLPSRRPENQAQPKKSTAGAETNVPAPAGERKIVQNALIARMLEESKAPSPTDPAAAQENLRRLRAEMEQARALEEKQFRLEGIQRRMFELEERLKHVDQLVASAQSAQAVAEGLPTLESLGLPPDGLERLRRYDDAVAKLDEAIKKLREDDLAAAANRPAKPEPVIRERNFQIGIGAGLAAFALGMFFRDTGARYIALLDIPAFGFAAITALQWIGDLQAFEAAERRLVVGKDREQKLLTEFDREYLPVKAALKLSGMETGRELLALLDRRVDAERQAKELQAALEAARSDPELVSARDEQTRLSAEAAALEEEISMMGGGATLRDWRSIEAEIQEIEASLASADAGLSTPVTATSGGVAAEEAPAVERVDPIPALLQTAQEILHQPLESIVGALRDRASQYLLALSDRRYAALELDSTGRAAATAPGRTIRAGQLEPADLDLLYLAVRLTLAERFAGQLRFPLIVEEPIADWPEAKQQLFGRMLKHIGTQGQVLHATASQVFLPLADAAAQL